MDENIARLQEATDNLRTFATERADWLLTKHPTAASASLLIVGLIGLLRIMVR